MISAVCGLLIENGLVLTVSRKDDHTKIGMPGGKVDLDESLIDAIIRETFEETGIMTDVIPCNGFVDTIDNFIVYCFRLRRVDDVIHETDESETGKVEFVPLSKLITDSPFSDYNKKALDFYGEEYELSNDS